MLANRASGLLVPGAPVLADLSGNGLPDLIVPNTGGNSVLVYPGLPGGGFGPALNDGNGFFTGTNPVAVVVADMNGDGRPDLIVANEGSNDVSILLNEPSGNGFTFVQGPRLAAGAGPVGLLFGDFSGDGIADILVSDRASKELTLLVGLGDGFYDDVNPPTFPLIETPGAIFAGPFEGGNSLDVAALDPDSGEVTLISGLATGAIAQSIISSGGSDPVAAFAVLGSNGFEDLVVANSADGRVSLLEGSLDGLVLEQVNNSLAGQSPTGLALASIHDNDLEVYASAEGAEAASLLLFSLSSASPVSSGPSLTLLPLQEQSLPLIATLSYADIDLDSSAEESRAAQGATAAVVSLSAITSVSLGQGPFGRTVENTGPGEEGELTSEIDAPLAPANDRAGLEASHDGPR